VAQQRNVTNADLQGILAAGHSSWWKGHWIHEPGETHPLPLGSAHQWLHIALRLGKKLLKLQSPFVEVLLQFWFLRTGQGAGVQGRKVSTAGFDAQVEPQMHCLLELRILIRWHVRDGIYQRPFVAHQNLGHGQLDTAFELGVYEEFGLVV